MRTGLSRWLAGLAGVASVAAGFLFSGTTAAFVLWAGIWSVPAMFCLYVLLSAAVFALVPPGSVSGKRLGFDTSRFERGRWKRIFDTGRFLAVLLVNLALGPIVAALAIRFLGISGGRAWLYAVAASLIAAIVMAGVYFGAGEIILSLL